MNVSCKFDNTENRYELNHAILVYSCGDREHAATINPVKDGIIMPGSPLNKELLAEELDKLAGKRKSKTFCMLPPNLLALGEKAMMWFAPSRVAPIWFKTGNEQLNKLSGKSVRYPAIVFRVIGGRMCAWAVYGNDRPAPAAMMFRMPFYNCSDDGWVCLPGGKTPKVEPENISAWEALFYDSNFSHSAMGGGTIVRGGHAAFWLRYVSQCSYKMPKRFPCEYLIPSGITYEETMNHDND